MRLWTFGFGALFLSASGALFLTQCGDSNLGTPGDVGGDAAGSCPANPPTNGTSCDLPSGTTCNAYPQPGCECCGSDGYVCENGAWQEVATSTSNGNNIAPACPVTLPEAGSTCPVYSGGCGGQLPAQDCTYPCENGGNAIAICSGTWLITAACNDDAGADASDAADGGD
jgi:hypothetical protein